MEALQGPFGLVAAVGVEALPVPFGLAAAVGVEALLGPFGLAVVVGVPQVPFYLAGVVAGIVVVEEVERVV